MKRCKCGKIINIMDNYCDDCYDKLSLRDKFIEDYSNTSYAVSEDKK